jgi:ABC-type multidrug transport system ATPase subunit
MNSVVLQQICKSYDKGRVAAVKCIDLEVKKGELFGLIGPDGSGKTTLFRILTTLMLPDSGSAFVAGYNVVQDYREIRHRVGYMPGKFSLYPDLSVAENLEFFASVFGTTVKEHYHLIRDIYVQLEPFKDRKAGKLSGGMKQKLALCCALIHKPEVLFLDEPTTGVDAVSRKEFWQMLKGLKEQEITIIVSTPYMDEAVLCERIALMQDGALMQVDTPASVIADYPSELFAVSADNMIGLSKALNHCSMVSSAYSFGVAHHVTLVPGSTAVQLEACLEREGISHCSIERIDPTIEDCFIKLMQS